jgi:hypothetical protein
VNSEAVNEVRKARDKEANDNGDFEKSVENMFGRSIGINDGRNISSGDFDIDNIGNVLDRIDKIDSSRKELSKEKTPYNYIKWLDYNME